jgi:hypothetical protein
VMSAGIAAIVMTNADEIAARRGFATTGATRMSISCRGPTAKFRHEIIVPQLSAMQQVLQSDHEVEVVLSFDSWIELPRIEQCRADR